jgi:hypothetical protein
VEWLLASGSFVCERDDLHAKKSPCPVCAAMPRPTGDTARVMRLYRRCRDSKALPAAGGMLDQPADLIEAFDIIDECVAAKRAKENHEAEREGEYDRIRREINGRG